MEKLTAEEMLKEMFHTTEREFLRFDGRVETEDVIEYAKAYALQEVHIALEKAAEEAKVSATNMGIIIDKQSITGIKIELT